MLWGFRSTRSSFFPFFLTTSLTKEKLYECKELQVLIVAVSPGYTVGLVPCASHCATIVDGRIHCIEQGDTVLIITSKK
jgi:hypothetical protein